MHCQRCGKFMSYNAAICRECESAEYAARQNYTNQNAYNPYQQPPYAQDHHRNGTPYGHQRSRAELPEDPYNPMYGFGKALTATILGFVACILLSIALEDFYDAGFLSLFALPAIVLSLIFGMKSIFCFVTRRAPCCRPVATFALGIGGLFFAGLSLFMMIAVLFLMMISGAGV